MEREHLVLPDALSRRDRLRWPLSILVTSLFAAIAYYVLIGGWLPRSANAPQLASVDPIAVAAQSASKGQRQQIMAQDGDLGRLALNESSSQIGKTSRIPRLPEGPAVATLSPNETAVDGSSSKKAIRALDSEEIKLLMRQGEQFAEAGDLVASRILFQRAAEAGDARAATALGATYDPTVLAKLGVVGISADLEKARIWYRMAVSLGSSDARRRLDLIVNR